AAHPDLHAGPAPDDQRPVAPVVPGTGLARFRTEAEVVFRVALLLPATDFGAQGMVLALVCEGEWCAGGGVDPVNAAPGTIRGDYALDFVYNIVHGCGSPESAGRLSRSTFWNSSALSRRPLDDKVLPWPRPVFAVSVIQQIVWLEGSHSHGQPAGVPRP